MWNNQNSGSGYPPPPGFPSSGMGFPSADPYGSPPGPPPNFPSYGPPPGPPPVNGASYPGSSYPGPMPAPPAGFGERGNHQHQHQHHQHHHKINPGGFAPPPSSYSPPTAGRPPPGRENSWSRPPGPPSMNSGSGHYGEAWGPNNNPHYRPPSGPPPNMGPQPFPYQPPTEAPHMPPSQMQSYGPQGQDFQPQFMYSQCNGRKKALLIGVNYNGTENQLHGCQNDANNVKQFIQRHYGYQETDTVMLTDDASRRPEEQPTRDNVIRAMQWLVRHAQPNDSLFFHFSGHGGLTKDLDGDEEDGFDSVIYPVDFNERGHIVDDEMHDIMVKPLPAGCRLTAIFDCCHSGSALDLPYIYSTEGKIKEPNLLATAGTDLLGAVTSYASRDYRGLFKNVSGLASLATGKQGKIEEFARRTKSSPADVISWSGCKDSQTSADTEVAGKGTGAMSWAFMESLNRNPQQSYQQLLVSIRALLREKYSQRPQLSSSHPMDTNILFIL